MGIFKKNISNNPNTTIFVGANLPLQVNMYLTLYSLATGISKSKLIANLVSQFQETTVVDMSIDTLIVEVAKKGFASFCIECKHPSFSSVKFFNDMKKELLKKGIDSKTCLSVIQKVKDETKHQ